METVGIIGVGLVGTAIAERIVQSGYQICGFDTDPGRRSALESLGGTWRADARSVAAEVQHLILSLPDSKAVGRVIQEVMAALPADALVVDTTTGDPTETSLLAEELAGHGIRHVDAAIVGSSEQVRMGEAVILAGGEPSNVAEVRGLLESFARLLKHVGPSGSGQRMKLVVNLALGLNRAVLAESLCFAEMLRIPPATALEVLKQTAAYSQVMETKGRKMVEDDFTPQARLAQHLKDVRLMLSQAKLRGRSLPLSELHATILDRLVQRGLGDLDNSAVIHGFRDGAARPGESSPE